MIPIHSTANRFVWYLNPPTHICRTSISHPPRFANWPDLAATDHKSQSSWAQSNTNTNSSVYSCCLITAAVNQRWGKEGTIRRWWSYYCQEQRSLLQRYYYYAYNQCQHKKSMSSKLWSMKSWKFIASRPAVTDLQATRLYPEQNASFSWWSVQG